MFDPTPPPYGDVTRRWTQLTDLQRQDHTHRLVGACPGDVTAHVDDPPLDDGHCYARLIRSALAGDEVAWGWLATTHRPLLLIRGRALLSHDPSEWGAVCLAAMHRTLGTIDLDAGPWLRRRITQQATRLVSRATAKHLASRRRERPTPPETLRRMTMVSPPDRQPHPELSRALTGVLADLDRPTRDALRAIAADRPLHEVADRYGLSYDAIRQRVTRARRDLQPELMSFWRQART